MATKPSGADADDGRPFLPLREYLDLAARMVGRHAPGHAREAMLRSEDAIGQVAHAMMAADWEFDPARSPSRSGYRGGRGRWAVLEYARSLGRLAARPHVPVPATLADPRTVEPVEAAIREEERQGRYAELRRLPRDLRDCLAAHRLGGHSQGRIAAAAGMSRATVGRRIREAEGMLCSKSR